MNIYLCFVNSGIILFWFISVSGIKNKMGFCNYSSEAMQCSQDKNLNKININDEFLHWFSGFTDAEGNFLITIDRNYVKLSRRSLLKLVYTKLVYRTISDIFKNISKSV